MLERRSKQRFPICTEAQYTIRVGQKPWPTGRGWIVDLSSSGALLEIDTPLPPGKPIELSIAWPVHLGDKAALRLLVRGRTIRSGRGSVAVRIEQHEFRVRPRCAASCATDRI